LLDGVSLKGAKGVIISITGGEDMRLMEVDEAASHIKELVDPDANIIWGSAFNNDLDGKIRVSVVATGIEAEAAVAAPPKGTVFAFPGSKPKITPAPVPVAQAPAVMLEAPEASEPAAVNDTLELSEPAPPVAAIRFEDDAVAGMPVEPAADELLLDQQVTGNPLPKAGSRWLAPENEAETAQPAPAAATLFERMSNIARTSIKPEESEVRPDPLDIPRFLNRQNNQ
jgi:cell division protein FtsZ